jgi:hypothetical protein
MSWTPRRAHSASTAFVTAPTTGSPVTGGDGAVFLDTAIANKLWSAIRNDSVAAFARRFPSTVTPGAPA